MDSVSSLLTFLLSAVPEAWRPYLGGAYVLVSGVLLVAMQLRKLIPPPPVGSRWVIPYRIMSALAGASRWAAPIYDVGMTAVRTTRSHAPALKAVAQENGIPVLSKCGKPVPPVAGNVVSSPKPDS